MKWEKKGLIIKAEGQREWMQTHIQNPYAVEMDDCIRIYYTTRPFPSNGLYKSVTAYMDLEKKNLKNVIRISDNPILSYGNIGTFDEDGIMPGSVVNHNNEKWLYYAGWSRKQITPYTWSIGLAISKDNGETFTKYSEGPIMSLNYDEPYLLAAPRSVFYENNLWHMHYGSGTGWINDNGKIESVYLNRHAMSKDGIHWERDEKPCIATIYDDESQSACCTYKDNGLYHMFFPYRHSYNFRNGNRGYLIGYAYSDNLKEWIRDDSQVGIDTSKEGWDSEMICYPHVININGEIIMFYCGNGFGVGGLGYATLKK